MDSGESWSKKELREQQRNCTILVTSYRYHPMNLIRKDKRGKPKTTRLGNIIQNMDLERLLRATDDRSQWRRTVNPRMEDDWSQVRFICQQN